MLKTTQHCAAAIVLRNVLFCENNAISIRVFRSDPKKVDIWLNDSHLVNMAKKLDTLWFTIVVHTNHVYW